MKGSFDIPVSSYVQRRYNRWKFYIPVIYDWFMNHNLYWPSLSCRWGPQFDETTYTKRQRLYLAEQTDGSDPNTLVIADCEIVKPRVASEDIRKFEEDQRSPNIKKHKAIIHPGEVNKIKEMPQNSNLLATHTDLPEVLIWDIDAQPARHAIPGADISRPNLILIGHTDNAAEYALAMSPTEPYVLSGGKDKNVVLWSLNDHNTYLAIASNNARQDSMFRRHDPYVGPRGIFQGHTDIVEDVQFCPTSAQEFCSVGDDSNLMLWDERVGPNPVIKVEEAHNEDDIHCVEWNNFDVNYILTGSADRSVHMYDRRNLNNGRGQNPVHTFEGHDASVLCVQWCPQKPSVFGTSGDDGIVNIWDYEKVGRASTSDGLSVADRAPPGLFFRHAGHKYKAIEFQWNPSDPWTIASLSHDCRGPGGGTLQVWRMMDIIYEEETNQERIVELNRLKPCTEGRSLSSIKNLSFSFV